MSGIIPPLLSNTPPPPPLADEDDDDEFGDFTGANDISYGCDNLSLPPSPDHLPAKVSILNGLDINSNANKNKISQIDGRLEKDFQDKRKDFESFNEHTNSQKNCCIEDVHKRELFFKHSINEFHIDLSPAENTEICKMPLDSDEYIKSEFSENGDKIVGTVNSYDNKQKINHDQEVLTKNLENETDDFVNSDYKTKHIADEADEKIYVDKEIVNETKINDIEKELTEHKTLELNKDINDIENSHCIPNDSVSSVLKSSGEDSKDIREDCIKEQDEIKQNVSSCPLKNITSNINGTEDCNAKSSQEEEAITSTVTINETEIGSHNQPKIDDISFGDFAFADISSPTEAKNDGEIIDEFGDFAEAAFKKTEHNETDLKSNFNVNNDDDFGDFSSMFPESIEKSLTEDNEFGDFATTTITTQQPEWNSTQCVSAHEDDDFGNFADFSQVVKEPVVLTLNEKQAFEKAESILKDMFPCPDNVQEDFLYVDVEKDDVVFNELKDVTDTPGLLYQWSKSSSQNVLLKALNIDARNILYGPPWNPSMPRFAANLGLKPLEPVKSEILTPTPSKSSPSITVSSPNVDIPSAQFDWNGSGLVNPLDSVSKETLEPSSPSDTTPKSLELSIEPSLILQPKLASPQDDFRKEPSKTDLEEKIDNDDFEDFTSFQPSQVSRPSNWSSVPLRETYISNDNATANISKEIPLDIEGWLQPTIVTPELPRKDLSLGEEELPDIQTPELSRKKVIMENLDDDFDDFQMVLPNEPSDNSAFSSVLEPAKFDNTSVAPISVDNLNVGQVSSSNIDKQIKVPIKEEPNKRSLELEVVEMKPNEDDEFTDFHSFTPIAQQAPKTLTPILEPLKPVPLYPTVQYPTTSTSQINWPDPGITDEEIKKFEMVFSQSRTPKPEPPKKEEPQTVKEEKKPQLENADEDEWSDFVSVQKPSPVHKFQSNEREHTSSPDLPLSVLNLGNIQPAKQPIPVITPHGLVQTKLSSHNPVNMSPKTHLKLVPQQKLNHQPHSQPSIISNQYASQAYNFNSYPSQSKASLNATSHSTGNVNQKSLDEDDWSDFVSSPLPPSTSNGYQQTWHNSLPHQHTGWTNASPNIIMNPGHFVQRNSDLRSKKVPNYSVTNKKNTIPNISIPDLEFIGPKGRTSSSRRK